MTEKLSLFEFEITDSTNRRAREYIEKGGSLPALFTAESQTEGRGRQGKSFYSPKGSGLYMSLVLPFTDELKNNITLTSATAVALLRVLSEYTEKKLSIKWVNDILADGKKVAGILCESAANPKTAKVEAIVIGIGVNITTDEFPKELSHAATSLGEKSFDQRTLALKISSEIIKILKENPIDVMNEYRASSAVLGQSIYYLKNGVRYDAEVLEILNDGALMVVRTDKTPDLLKSGEITLRIK